MLQYNHKGGRNMSYYWSVANYKTAKEIVNGMKNFGMNAKIELEGIKRIAIVTDAEGNAFLNRSRNLLAF
jgi:hypothetical protein